MKRHPSHIRPAESPADRSPVRDSRAFGSAIARAQVAGGLAVKCPQCFASIQASSVQVGVTFDRSGGIADLYLLNPEGPLTEVVDDVRRLLVRRAIVRADGNMSEAARMTGMKYTTFWDLAKRLGIEAPQHEAEPHRRSA